jgi:hypothetical protein
MNIKAFLAVLIILACAGATAQPKAYSFSDIQYRNHKQQWQEFLKADEDCVAYFSESEIALNIDQLYHLTIKSTTHLPNGGVIYLCKDDAQKDMTITLIGNERMFVYNKEKRFQIIFAKRAIANAQTPLPKAVQTAATTTVATAAD